MLAVLRDLGMESDDSGNCLKRAWLLGHQPLPTCEEDLEREIASTPCENCGEQMVATVWIVD